MIVGQSLYQLAATLVLYFAGARLLDYDLSDPNQRLELHTVIFNTFVWMQIVNQLNSRRLDNHFNIFHRLHRDIFFVGITAFTAGLQVVIIFFGSAAFQIHPGGLDGTQWAICIIIALVSLAWGALVRLAPDVWAATSITLVRKALRPVNTALDATWLKLRRLFNKKLEDDPAY